MNQQQITNVLTFYALANKLKTVIRTGWKRWNVQRDRIESVAEHIFGTQMLAVAMWSEGGYYDLDLRKVILMLALHELEEIVIPDYTPYDGVTKAEKAQQGHAAVHVLLDGLIKQPEIEALVLEFDAQETAEAQFAHQCDKLECDLQCCLYDKEGCVDLSAQENNPIMQDALVQELFQKGLSWSQLWCEVDRRTIGYDDNFLAVLSAAVNSNAK